MITFLEWLGRDLYDLLWQPSLEMALLATSLTYDWDANQLLLGAELSNRKDSPIF